jgi:hypothetical protein
LFASLSSVGMGAWLGDRARVENWWGWGALEESPALTLVDGGWDCRPRRRPALLI